MIQTIPQLTVQKGNISCKWGKINHLIDTPLRNHGTLIGQGVVD